MSVVYCAFYFEEKKTRDGSSHYVLKYSLTKNGQYLEQESLVEYQLAATSHFADLHSGSEPAAVRTPQPTNQPNQRNNQPI